MTALEEIKKAFPNMFRPLKWEHFEGKTEHGKGEWWAHATRGMFHIYDVRETYPNDRPFYAKELSDQFDTLELAQEAYQKRHEADIVMCLDPGFLSTLESLQRENEASEATATRYANEIIELRGELAKTAALLVVQADRADAAEAELDSRTRALDEAEASMKRLRDTLHPFAEAADYYSTGVHRTPAPDALPCGPALIVAHLRAARTALASREGDTHKPVAYVCAADMELLGKSSDGWDFSMSPKPRPDLGMNMALYAAPLAETSKPDPVLWVSPVDLRAWQKAKAGEIWAWSENIEGQCVPLYTGPQASSMDALPDVGQWTDDERARVWREAFETMHQRAMKAENSLSAAAPPAPSVAVNALHQAASDFMHLFIQDGQLTVQGLEDTDLIPAYEKLSAALSAQVQDVAGLLDETWNAAVEQAAAIANDCVHLTPDPGTAIRTMLNGRTKPLTAAPAKQEGCE